MNGARISPLAGKLLDPAQLIKPADLIEASTGRWPERPTGGYLGKDLSC